MVLTFLLMLPSALPMGRQRFAALAGELKRSGSLERRSLLACRHPGSGLWFGFPRESLLPVWREPLVPAAAQALVLLIAAQSRVIINIYRGIPHQHQRRCLIAS